MIKFKIWRPTEKTAVVKYECGCAAINIRSIYAKSLEFTPFVCWRCFLILPDLVDLVSNENSRINYHISKIVPRSLKRNT
jgi:hypothetical protein